MSKVNEKEKDVEEALEQYEFTAKEYAKQKYYVEIGFSDRRALNIIKQALQDKDERIKELKEDVRCERENSRMFLRMKTEFENKLNAIREIVEEDLCNIGLTLRMKIQEELDK